MNSVCKYRSWQQSRSSTDWLGMRNLFNGIFAMILTGIVGYAGPAFAITSSAATESNTSSSSESTPFQKSQPTIFDWSQELIGAEVPEVGHRYAQLNREERKSLRQGFKLPLDAIAKADTTSDLFRLAIVRPLPDPAKPFIPVDANGDASSNPFAQEDVVNDLGPLGRMFALEGTAAKAKPASNTSTNSTADSDPFASDDPFASEASVPEPKNDSPPANETPESTPSEDPFDSIEGGFEADPFADF